MSEERDDNGLPPPLGPLYANADGLGDLPRPLATERGERKRRDSQGSVPPGVTPGDPSQIADLDRQTDFGHQLDTRRISRKAPPLAYSVGSVYDSRPIQGTDFQKTDCNEIEFIALGGGSTFDSIFVDYIVPENKIAVLRGFKYVVDPQPIGIVTEGFCWLQSDLFDNSTIFQDYSEMLHPLVMRDLFPVFRIVDENHTIRLRLSKKSDAVLTNTIIGDLLGVEFTLYGNLILKTGVPKEFETANRIV